MINENNSGTLSVKRADFEKLITENGGSVCKTVTNSVTHLVSSETGTKKCDEAEAKGVKIVDEDWVRNQIENGGGGDEDEDDDDEDEEEEEEEEDNGEKGEGGKGDESTALTGMCFAITGLEPFPSLTLTLTHSVPQCFLIARQAN
jgi:BRCT domain type II-containing protein